MNTRMKKCIVYLTDEQKDGSYLTKEKVQYCSLTMDSTNDQTKQSVNDTKQRQCENNSDWVQTQKTFHSQTVKQSLSPKDIAAFYNNNATDYEKFMHPANGLFHAAELIAKEIGDLYSVDREMVKVIDVASGTGFLSECLYNMGFRQIDALDASQGLLDICRKKNICNNLFCEFITDQKLPIAKGSYDCLGIAGGMSENHIEKVAFKEMIRIVKSGGFICISGKQAFRDATPDFKDGQLDEYMSDLEKAGMWKKIVNKVVPSYSATCDEAVVNDGFIFVYQVCNKI